MLTDTAIRRAAPGERDYKMADRGGLFLLVTAAGGKLWRWKYRFEGKEKKMAFGQYPEVTLAEVRERHAIARRLLASGVDPMEQRRAEKTAAKGGNGLPFRQVAAQWHEHWKTGNSAHHVKATWSRLETNVFPALGSRPVSEIKPSEIVAVVNSIQAQRKLDIAKRALETTKQIFRYAIAHDLAEQNPAGGIKLAEQNPAGGIKAADILTSRAKVNHARVEAKELPALLRDIELYQGRHVTRLAMKLLAMTFVRTSELIGAQWAEFDFENARWDIPAERMKMRTPHIVSLSTQALDVLEHLKLLSGDGELLFPGERDAKKPMSNMTILEALNRMGYKGRMTGHGFRGLASTILHEQGYNHEHIELQLAHAPRNAVSAAYNHALYLAPRARMMQDWASFLERTQRMGKVLPFRHDAA
jgi:integrase